jgi:hypothetical protein
MNNGTCVICNNKGDYEFQEVDGCIARVCPVCKANIAKGGVRYAEKVAAEIDKFLAGFEVAEWQK